MSEKTSKDWGKVREDIDSQEDGQEAEEMEALNEEQEHLDESTRAVLEHPSYRELEEQLTLAEQKAHESWEKSVRAQAELDNVRRRAEKDVANAHRYGLEKFVNTLLPVVDSLEQALQIAHEKEDAAMSEGLELTLKLLLETLNKYGIDVLDPLGEIFDPQVHEAMSIQVSDEAEPNSILTVFQKGYKISDRVIRPARVIVAKGK